MEIANAPQRCRAISGLQGAVGLIHFLITISLLCLVLYLSVGAEALFRMWQVRGGFEIAGPMGEGFDVACSPGAMTAVRAALAWKYLMFPAVASAVCFVAWPSALAAAMSFMRQAAMDAAGGGANSPQLLARPGGAWYLMLAATVLLAVAVHESLTLEKRLGAPAPPALAAPAAAWPPPAAELAAHERKAAEAHAQAGDSGLPSEVAVVAS